MKLTAKVINLESGTEWPDGQQRVAVKVKGATSSYSTLKLPNTDGLQLDQELEVFGA